MKSEDVSHLLGSPASVSQRLNGLRPLLCLQRSVSLAGGCASLLCCWFQTHSMVGVGRDLCGSPSPAPCRSRVTQSRLHSTASRRGWNISREGVFLVASFRTALVRKNT